MPPIIKLLCRSTALILTLGCTLWSPPALAADAAKKAAASKTAATKKAATPTPPQPTIANVAYGTQERQVLDFWKAESSRPTPLLFFIHGGGWQAGDKSRVASMVKVEQLLAAGISVVSINYRYVSQAHAAGIKPPVQAPLHDAARALQFVRSKSAEWNIDKIRIGASGGSAGACTSLWLAFHSDLADPDSFYSAPPALGQDQKDPTHTANFGVKLQERCRSEGVACELVYPGAPGMKHATIQEYLIAMINPGQVTCRGMEPAGLKKGFGDQLTFWGGGCDTREMISKGTPAQVRDQVRRLMDIWRPGGGYVFQQVHNIMADVPPANVVALPDTPAGRTIAASSGIGRCGCGSRCATVCSIPSGSAATPRDAATVVSRAVVRASPATAIRSAAPRWRPRLNCGIANHRNEASGLVT